MKGLSPDEHKGLLLSVGTHQRARPLSPIEVARLLQKTISKGATRKICADALRIGQSQVAQFLKLLQLDEGIQDRAGWGSSKKNSIAFSSLAQLARLKKKSEQREATDAIIKHKLTNGEVKQMMQLSVRSEKPIEQCINEVIQLRPKIEIRRLTIGAVNQSNRQYLQNLSGQERDRLMTKILKTLLGERHLAKGQLSAERFTIRSKEDILKMMNMSVDELEASVNQAIDEAFRIKRRSSY